MAKPIVTLNNSEHAIINELKEYRDRWYEASEKLNAENHIIMFPIVDIYEKQYQQARAFVCRAWNVSTAKIDGILDGEYTIVESEAIEVRG